MVTKLLGTRIAIHFAPMRHLAPLAWKVALSQGLVLSLGYLAATQAGTLHPYQVQAIVAGLVGIWLVDCLLIFGVARLALRPLAEALEVGPALPPAQAARAASLATSVPAVASRVLLGVGVVGCVITEGITFLRHGLHYDLALAALGIVIAISLLGALIAYALCARAAAELVERLGAPAEPRTRGTLRGKILALGLGLSVIGVLLVAAIGYIRHRESVTSELGATAARIADWTVARTPGQPAAVLAAALARDSGLPAAVLSPEGQVLAVAGAVPRGAEPVPLAPGVARTAAGWTVTREARGGGFVRLFLDERAVMPRMRPFAGSLLIAALITFAASAALAWLAATAITLPFRTLGNAADRIAAGDLTASPPSVSTDEMGLLAAQFRRMAQGLTGLVREVQAASENVSTGAVEAGSIGEQVRRGALEQHEGVRAVQGAVEAMEGSMALVSRGVVGLSDYVSATSRTVGEMAEAFDEVHRKAVELERAMASALGDVEGLGSAGRDAEARLGALESLAARSGGTLADVKTSVTGLERAATESESTAAAVAEMADRAGMVVEGTVHGIETLRGAVADAHQRIAVLGRRSDDIDQVVDFISEVAGRTNLLSLNASIIAAQAGEHGKAFAVVADQIRDLASQIARSTKSIGDIIRAVRQDVEGTAALIDRGDALAAEGVQLARNSLGALGEIRRSTARGRETAAAIRAAVLAHAQSSREMAGLVELVAEGSRAVAAAVQMVGRSVGGVHTISRGVTGMADRVARTLEEQSGLGKRQLENLSRLENMIQEITRAVENHAAATQRVKKALQALSHAAGEHESAVHGLSGISDQIGSSARALSDRVNRFKV
jgi:methyl-accepting chemotaxis protein